MQFEYQFQSPQSFNLMDIQEPIALGQRVEAFLVEGYAEGEWKLLGQGTTVGYKRILELPQTTTDKVRVTITHSRLNPKISKIGFYQR